MKIQVVVPCINLWEKYTRPMLDTVDAALLVAQSKGIETRVQLVDNASGDETLVEAGKRVSAYFAHKRNEERWGFQKSVNFGVNDAWERGFDAALVCNNDILLHPRAIVRLCERVNAATDDENLGMVTCMDVRGETTPAAFSALNDADKEGVPEAPNPNFSAFMVLRRCWEEVGEMDELFAPAYFEDNDYHYRMKLAGLKAVVYPPALFYHFGSATQNEAMEKPLVPSSLFDHIRARYVGKWGGTPGTEVYKHPYNNEEFAITRTKQDV